jgi:hypothetical protein
VNVAVAPIAVFDAVTAGSKISPLSLGFAPDVSVMNILITLNEEAAAAAWADVKVILFNREPSVVAVKTVANVPLPSLAVLAAARRANPTLGTKVKIGDVFAGMLSKIIIVKKIISY